jgi:hypothetical protein
MTFWIEDVLSHWLVMHPNTVEVNTLSPIDVDCGRARVTRHDLVLWKDVRLVLRPGI